MTNAERLAQEMLRRERESLVEAALRALNMRPVPKVEFRTYYIPDPPVPLPPLEPPKNWPVWAEWAAWQWAINDKTQTETGHALGLSPSQVSTGIYRFLGATCPQHLSRSQWGTVIIHHKLDVARELFANWPEPPPPAGYPKIPSYRPLWPRAALGRVFDPDEATAPRDVWMTFSPGPGFDFMEPVT